ncbi:MAG: right-handed parallel beta-helix repeat-containing protein [Phycisphaeraceae bacterium]|nr:right-handed parallel beta-helix repeat-containing protein [Phycisphaeraceae bacterium]
MERSFNPDFLDQTLTCSRRHRIKRFGTLGAALLLAIAGSTTAPAGVIFVNGASPSSGDGLSWTTAFNTMDSALAAAQSGDQLWVTKGIYSTPNVYTSFMVPTGASLYGGFSGTETDLSQARPNENVTILKAPVSYHEGSSVLVLESGGGMTISGFTIRDGYAPRLSGTRAGGGGVLVQGGTVSILHCVLANNSTYTVPNGDFGQGGAICIVNSADVTISDCHFDSNFSHGWPEWDFIVWPRPPLPGHGGAIYVDGSTLVLRNSTFSSNRGGETSAECITGNGHSPGAAASGGALYALNSSLAVFDCDFFGNSAGSSFGITCGFPDPVFGYDTQGARQVREEPSISAAGPPRSPAAISWAILRDGAMSARAPEVRCMRLVRPPSPTAVFSGTVPATACKKATPETEAPFSQARSSSS